MSPRSGKAPAIGPLLLLLLAGCAGARFPAPKAVSAPAAYPPASFAVLSDIHVYDASLGTTGLAFAGYLSDDRKLLVESEEILATAFGRIAATDASFVVISGDLTKDGEESSHRLVAAHLRAMEQTGPQVYVVPGNHDVRNPDAVRYLGERTEPVKHLEPEEFAALYADFGYGEALERDPGSLSYLAGPVPGLWLLAIDSCDTASNLRDGKPKTGSSFTRERVAWIVHILERAAAERKAVIAVLHHGVVPHFASEPTYFGDYLAGDYAGLARLLARSGVRVAFTGHEHAQDIAVRRWKDGSFIYDVETGSAATWPCPYRLVTVGDGTLRIESRRIEELPSFSARGEDFVSHARRLTNDGVAGVAVRIMTEHGVNRAEAVRLSGQIADAMLAHYAGDERFEGEEMLTTRGLSLMGRIVVATRKNLVYDLWRDPEPPDNELSFRMDTGEVLGGSP
jgi:3',5'-cyclic AMP phosphodiesterase CpdA